LECNFIVHRKIWFVNHFTIVSIIGFFGYRVTFANLEEVAANGDNVTVLNVNNKNSESVVKR